MLQHPTFTIMESSAQQPTTSKSEQSVQPPTLEFYRTVFTCYTVSPQILPHIQKIQTLATVQDDGAGEFSAKANTAKILKYLETQPFSDTVLLLLIDTLLNLKFYLPMGDHTRITPTWQSVLFKRIQIPTNENVLDTNLQIYPWYAAALRSSITILHVSPTGIPLAILEFIHRLNKRGSPLAFALSPTTLHHNNLLHHSLAKIFTAVPLSESLANPCNLVALETTYKNIITEGTIMRFAAVDSSIAQCTSTIATRRIRQFLKFLGNLIWTLENNDDSVGLLLGGGSASAACMDEESWLTISKDTDVDLFVYGDLESDRLKITKLILEHLVGLGGVLKQFGSVFQIEGLEKPVQVICSPARSQLGVLVNFDSSFIQVGYQGSNNQAKDTWCCTPSFNFFTPRKETLLTRYNVKLDRLLKSIRRGFIPVSDERGHIINPSRLFISSTWLLDITEREPKTKEWIEMKSRVDYVLMRGYTAEELVEMLGDAYTKNPDKAIMKLKIDQPELYEECLRQTKAAVLDDIERRPLDLTSKYVGPNSELRNDKKFGEHTVPVSASKRPITWVPVTVEEGLEDFTDRGNTLCNGFDIYTEWINSTLPLPNDGKVEDISYAPSVLLRNMQFVSETTDKINVGTEKEPILVEQGTFMDPNEKYPGNVHYYNRTPHADPYRQVEGIFLFGDIKSEKQIVDEWTRDREMFDMQQERASKKYQNQAKSRDAAIARSKNLKVKSLPTMESSEPEEEGSEQENDLPSIPEVPTVKATLSSGDNDNNARSPPTSPQVCKYQKPSVQQVCTKSVSQPGACKIHTPTKKEEHSEEENGLPPLEAAEPQVSEVVAETTAPVAEKKKQPSGWEKKRIEWLNKLKYEDLHKFIEEAKDIQTIDAWELPMLIKAFAKGKKIYKIANGSEVHRDTGMVKVRAVIQFVPCMIFDVDDLFVHQSTVDQHPRRSYNAVIQLTNFHHWIIGLHKHSITDIGVVGPSNREKILQLLGESLERKLKLGPSGASSSARKMLKMVRQISDSEAFENKIAHELCSRPHAAEGLLGKMPLFSCSRLYISNHETPVKKPIVAVAAAEPSSTKKKLPIKNRSKIARAPVPSKTARAPAARAPTKK